MDINKLKLTPDSSIEEALKIVGQERVRLGIIVDKKDKFLGVISDSNIRKALISGKTLKDSI
ncbi:CBS domain-containing protein, partial [Campylobacter jejuni]|nr:CBS domain-containing protein [Campylobacter jejuni]